MSVPVTACATGVTALGEAYRRLIRGEADVMIAGGTDSVMRRWRDSVSDGWARCRRRTTRRKRRARPSLATATARCVGERRRGSGAGNAGACRGPRRRRSWQRSPGTALTSDGYHLAAPDPEGKGAAAAMRLALAASRRGQRRLGWISAHGTGTQLNDLSETVAIKRLFGERRLRHPGQLDQGRLGHMLGAAGAISAVTAVKAMREGVIPATINYATPDPDCDLDYVPNVAREARHPVRNG